MNEHEEYLAHHGILGMKWGVRRYQNYDGTLTPAGRAKLAKVADSESAQKRHTKLAKKVYKNENKTAKKMQRFTDKEIRNTERQRGHREITKAQYVDRISRLTERGKKWAEQEIESGKMLDKVNDGAIKAGRDFFVQTDYNWYGLYSTLDRKVITV